MKNTDLSKPVAPEETELKEIIINYVGKKLNPDNNDVTVEDIINVFAEQFPEFLLALAEENWIRGYQQALDDITEGEKLYKQELAKAEDENSEE